MPDYSQTVINKTHNHYVLTPYFKNRLSSFQEAQQDLQNAKASLDAAETNQLRIIRTRMYNRYEKVASNLQSSIKQAQQNIQHFLSFYQGKLLIFACDDLHGYNDLSSFLDMLRYVRSNHIGPLQVVIAGDTNAKGGNDFEFSSLETKALFEEFVKIAGRDNVILIFGNHDTPYYGGDFSEFVKNVSEVGVKILSNTPDAFVSGDVRNKLCCAYTLGRIGYVSWMTNFANTGLDCQKAVANFYSPWEKAFCLFYQDHSRAGVPNKLFNIDSKFLKNWPNKTQTACIDPNHLIGDPSCGLNPIARDSADSFFGMIRAMADKLPNNSPIRIVVIAHDHYLNVIRDLEFLSWFCPEYRLSRQILNRLHITFACGHESTIYSQAANLRLYDDQQQACSLPCWVASHGVYGHTFSLFAFPDIDADSIQNRQTFQLGPLTEMQSNNDIPNLFSVKNAPEEILQNFQKTRLPGLQIWPEGQPEPDESLVKNLRQRFQRFQASHPHAPRQQQPIPQPTIQTTPPANDQSSSKTIVAIATGASVLCILGYLAYRYFHKS